MSASIPFPFPIHDGPCDPCGNVLFHYLSYIGNVSMFDYVCQVFPAATTRRLLMTYNSDMCLPIHIAVASGQVEIVRRLARSYTPDDLYEVANRATKTTRKFSLYFLCVGFHSVCPFVDEFEACKILCRSAQTLRATTPSTQSSTPSVKIDDDRVANEMFAAITEVVLLSPSLCRTIAAAVQPDASSASFASSSASAASASAAAPSIPASPSTMRHPRLLLPSDWICMSECSANVVSIAVRYENKSTLLRLLQYTAALCPTLRVFSLNIEWFSFSNLRRFYTLYNSTCQSSDVFRSIPPVASMTDTFGSSEQLQMFHRMFATFMLSLPETTCTSAPTVLSFCTRGLLLVRPLVALSHRQQLLSHDDIDRFFRFNAAQYFTSLATSFVDFSRSLPSPSGDSSSASYQSLVCRVADKLSQHLAGLEPSALDAPSTRCLVLRWLAFLFTVFAQSGSKGATTRMEPDRRHVLQMFAVLGQQLQASVLEDLSKKARFLFRSDFCRWMRETCSFVPDELSIAVFSHMDDEACTRLELDTFAQEVNMIYESRFRENSERDSIPLAASSLFCHPMYGTNPLVGELSASTLQRFADRYFSCSRLAQPHQQAFFVRLLFALRQLESAFPPCDVSVCRSAALFEQYMNWCSFGETNGVHPLVEPALVASDMKSSRPLGGVSVYGNAALVTLSTSRFGDFSMVLKTSQSRQVANASPSATDPKLRDSMKQQVRLCDVVNFPGFPLSQLHDFLVGRLINLVRRMAPCFAYTLGAFSGPVISSREFVQTKSSSAPENFLSSLFASAIPLRTQGLPLAMDYLAYEFVTPFSRPAWFSLLPDSFLPKCGSSTLMDYLQHVRAICHAESQAPPGSTYYHDALDSIEYDICSFVVQLANTLSVLNQWCNFVHYDLKHDNVLLEDSSVRYESSSSSPALVDLPGLERCPTLADSVVAGSIAKPTIRLRHRCGTLAPVIIDYGMSHVVFCDRTASSSTPLGIDYISLDQGVTCANYPGQDLYFFLYILRRYTDRLLVDRLDWLFAPFRQAFTDLKDVYKIPLNRPEFSHLLHISGRSYLEYLVRACPRKLSSMFVDGSTGDASHTSAPFTMDTD